MYSDENKINEIKESLDAEQYRFCVSFKEDIIRLIDIAGGRNRQNEDINEIVGVLEQETCKKEDEFQEGTGVLREAQKRY